MPVDAGAEGGNGTLRAPTLLPAALEALPVGVLVAEAPSGRLLLGNQQVARIWRHPFIAARDTGEYGAYRGFHPDGRPYEGHEWPLARTVSTGEVVDGEEVAFQRGDGTRGILQVSSAPVHDEAGTIIAAVVIFDDVTERVELRSRMALLAAAGEALAGSLDIEAVTGTVGRIVLPRHADWWALDLVDEETGGVRRVVSGHVDPDKQSLAGEIAGLHPLDTHGDAGPALALRTGTLVSLPVIDDAVLVEMAQSERHLALLRAAGPTSALYVPLTARGRTIGVLLLAFTADSGRRYEPDDVTFLLDLARRCALALDNAILYAGQRRLAEALQKTMLPRSLPPMASGEVAVRYVPSLRDSALGGDFYDVVGLPGGRVALAVGDVAGHGIAAAAAMGERRSALRAYALTEPTPGAVVARLNALEEVETERTLLTLVHMVYDPAAGTLTYTSAGHPPPLLRRADGTVVRLPAPHGPPVGATDDRDWEVSTVPFGPGDTVVLYTDGLVERRTTPIDVGIALLAEVLADEPADVEALCDEMLRRSGLAAGEDDVAVLAFRAAPVAPPLDGQDPGMDDFRRRTREDESDEQPQGGAPRVDPDGVEANEGVGARQVGAGDERGSEGGIGSGTGPGSDADVGGLQQ